MRKNKVLLAVLSCYLGLSLTGCQSPDPDGSTTGGAISFDAGASQNLTTDQSDSILLNSNYSGVYDVKSISWTQVSGEHLSQGKRVVTESVDNDGNKKIEVSYEPNEATGDCQFEKGAYNASCPYSLAMPADILIPQDYVFKSIAVSYNGVISSDKVSVHLTPKYYGGKTLGLITKSEYTVYPGDTVDLIVSATGIPETINGNKGVSYQWKIQDAKGYDILSSADGNKASVTIPNSIIQNTDFIYSVTAVTSTGEKVDSFVTIHVLPISGSEILIDSGNYDTVTLTDENPIVNVTLNGSKTKTLKGNNVNLYYLWRYVSGGETPSMNNLNSVDSATVTFKKAGTYIFELLVDDKPITDESLIPSNQRQTFYISVEDQRITGSDIIANAGSAQVLHLTEQNTSVVSSLDGSQTAYTNEKEGSIYYHWEYVSGGTSAPTIANQDSKIASVEFNEAGNFLFTLYVSNEPISLPIDATKFNSSQVSNVTVNVIDDRTLPRELIADAGLSEAISGDGNTYITFNLDGSNTHWVDGYSGEIHYCWTTDNSNNPESITISSANSTSASFVAKTQGVYTIYLFVDKDTIDCSQSVSTLQSSYPLEKQATVTKAITQ